jgi:hypothetical protein
MKSHSAVRFRFVLPLPAFVLHPLTALVVAAVHVYLAAGHLSQLIGGDVQWTHFWKGCWAAPTSSCHWRRAGLQAKKIGTFTQALHGRGEEEWLDSHQHEEPIGRRFFLMRANERAVPKRFLPAAYCPKVLLPVAPAQA